MRLATNEGAELSEIPRNSPAAKPSPPPVPALPDLTNTPKWRDIASGAKYKALSDADKNQLQAKYFDEVIAPYVRAANLDIESERHKFMAVESIFTTKAALSVIASLVILLAVALFRKRISALYKKSNPKMPKIYGVVLLVVLALAWFFRWETVPVINGDRFGGAYRINRWTGSVELLRGAQIMNVKAQD